MPGAGNFAVARTAVYQSISISVGRVSEYQGIRKEREETFFR
jgi:hypothetical protein